MQKKNNNQSLPKWCPEIDPKIFDDPSWEKVRDVFLKKEFKEMWLALAKMQNAAACIGFIICAFASDECQILKEQDVNKEKLAEKYLSDLKTLRQKVETLMEGPMLHDHAWDEIEEELSDFRDSFNDRLKHFENYFYVFGLAGKAQDPEIIQSTLNNYRLIDLMSETATRKNKMDDAKAIQLGRILHHAFKSIFKKPQTKYIVDIVNAIYGTQYSENNINTNLNKKRIKGVKKLPFAG